MAKIDFCVQYIFYIKIIGFMRGKKNCTFSFLFLPPK